MDTKYSVYSIIMENSIIMTIIYGVVGSLIAAIIMKWSGLLKSIWIWRKNKKALSNYRKSLFEECNNLIVVGKKDGFRLKDVYVDLDIAKSDLMQTKLEDSESQRIGAFSYGKEEGAYVLLGGPGAGKSTKVKNIIIKALECRINDNIPFFIRLKEYDPSVSLFDFIIKKLEQYKFASKEDIIDLVRKNLSNPFSLCVLDGLDEVRPHLRTRICDAINAFYSQYMQKHGSFIVTCRKEAYRDIPLSIPRIMEVVPLSDDQIERFAEKWPIEYPKGKDSRTFMQELNEYPNIKLLASSPLLLVGGLMHYSESNLGIPEERFLYLQTMARWLVVDWATAQGHISDPYRQLYDRILTSMSYYMHKNEVSEMTIDNAETFIATLLPDFGYKPGEASEILKSISERTGILVKDGGNIFFAQFGLQEFYVSKELLSMPTHIDISKLKLPWWREVILLYAAQQKNPSEILYRLFNKEPLLAITSVAECPTPSIEMLNKAMNVCIEYVDKKDESVLDVLVTFMRKVKDDVEYSFYTEIEKRLQPNQDKEIKYIVANALMRVGTIKANEILEKHSEIWNICLENAKGYLSTSFEDLLVNWIKNKEGSDSEKAANLLYSRLTDERMHQLLKILPTLSNRKKEYISTLLLKHLIINSRSPYHEDNIDNIPIITELVPNISRHFFKSIKKEINAYCRESYVSMLSYIAIIFSIYHNNKKLDLLSTYTYGVFWRNNYKSITYWICATIMLLIPLLNRPLVTLIALIFSSIFCIILHILRVYQMQSLRSYTLNRNYRLDIIIFFLLGAVVMLFTCEYFNSITINGIDGLSVLIFSSLLYMLAMFNTNMYCFNRIFKHKNINDIRFYALSNFRMTTIIFIVISWIIYVLNYYYDNICSFGWSLTVGYLLIMSYGYLKLIFCWKIVKKARNASFYVVLSDYNYHRR